MEGLCTSGSHMHVHAVTRVHAVTPKLVISGIRQDGGFDDRGSMPFE